jgi:ankyrin repeat protein
MSNRKSSDKNNNPFANVLDNYLRYIDNLELDTPPIDKEIAQEIKRLWRREIIKNPTIFAKCFSDNPSLLAEAKREVAQRLYEMEHPPS